MTYLYLFKISKFPSFHNHKEACFPNEMKNFGRQQHPKHLQKYSMHPNLVANKRFTDPMLFIPPDI